MLAWLDRLAGAPMPRAPRPTGPPVELWLPATAARFPAECPGCGRAADGVQSIVHEQNPFVRGGGVIQLHVPFCADCIALTGRRRRAVWVRAGTTLALAFVAINGAGVWQGVLLAREAWAAASIVRFAAVAVVLAIVLYLLMLVRVDRASYARALAALYPGRPASP